MKLHLSSNADQIFDVRGEPGIKTRAKTLRRKDRMFFKKKWLKMKLHLNVKNWSNFRR